MQNKKRAFSIIILILIGVLCSLYFYNQLIHIEIPIHSDDAGTATDLRDIIEFGNTRWSYWVSPLSWINGLLYIFFGATELFIQSFFAIKYFLCITLTLYLALYNKKKTEWWIVPIFLFFSMPGSFGTASIQPLKFHVWTILVPLFCLAYILAKGDDIKKLGKKEIGLLVLLSVLGLAERDILIIVTCWAPFALYWVIYFVQKGYAKKYINWILTAGITVLIVGKVLLGGMVYGGYGASKFVNVQEFMENIGTGISGFLTMFNINLIGADVLQFSTLISGMRLLLLVVGIGVLVSETREMCQKKIENMSVVEAILTISVYVIIIAYLFGGKREDEISIRYAAYLYYIFLILLCRRVHEMVDQRQIVVQLRRYKINMASVFFCVCIIIALDPVTMTREENENDVLANVILSNEELECGLASFWNAGVISCLTNYHNEIQAAGWNNGQVLPYLTEWDSYRSGNRYYNFFVQDTENDYGITEDHLKETFGEYEEKYAAENSYIYLYDYDIRTAPLNIEADSMAYLSRNQNLNVQHNKIQVEPQNEITLDNIYITAGKVRVIVNGTFGQNDIELSSEQTDDITLTDSRKNQCIYEVTADKLYENMKFDLRNVSENQVEIQSVRIERLENSIELLKGETQQKLHLTPGYYIFGVEGENVKNSDMAFALDGNVIDAERINNGRKKAAYGVWVMQDGELSISLGLQGQVEKLYYQNEVLTTIGNPKAAVYNYGSGIKINEKDDLLYGPYKDMETGSYIIDIYGKKLDDTSIGFSCEGGVPYKQARMLSNNPEHYVYKIDTQLALKEFEVLISGVNETDAEVYYYTITKEEDTLIERVDLTYSYSDEHVFTTGVKDEEKKAVVLNQDEICFGPYVDLQEGKYFVTIHGENLADAEISITAQGGNLKISELEFAAVDEEKIEVCFAIKEFMDDIEVVVTNNQKEQIEIRNYTITSRVE
ncbi:MAG: hypothetical protein ACLT3H_05695 [Roseburia sp.]